MKKSGVLICLSAKKIKLNHQGFTLIELLVSLLLTSVLLLGVLQVFSSSRDAIITQNRFSDIQDSARVALEFLVRDIKNADFTGCLSDKSEITNLLSPVGNYDPSVHEYFSLGGINAYVADGSNLLGGKIVKPDSDVIQVVSAEPVCPANSELSVNTDTLAPLTLREGCDIDDGTVLLVANCRSGNIFVKTDGVGNLIGHNSVSVEGLQNNQERFTEVFSADATLMRPYVRTYFIAEGLNGNDALHLREDGRNFELVSNISNLNYEFGIDTDSNGTANLTVTTDELSAYSPRRIVSVTLEILATDTDNEINRIYATSVNIRNRMAPAYSLTLASEP